MPEKFAIETENLCKQIKNKQIIRKLDIQINKGSIYGFLGPNGSGKTTTMKMLLGLSQPTEGVIKIFGSVLDSSTRGAFTGRIGGLIEEPPGYKQLTGRENLELIQRLLKFPKENVDWALNQVGLTPNQNKKISQYSLGMKQRLGIALAIVSKPDILILDEPINGLDPAGIEEIRQLFLELAYQGTTIMISSHILAELEKISSHFGIISDGRLIFQGERGDLIDSYANSLFIRTPDIKEACSVVKAARITKGGVVIPNVTNSQINAVCARLIESGISLHEVSRQQESLEEIFMSITKGDQNA